MYCVLFVFVICNILFYRAVPVVPQKKPDYHPAVICVVPECSRNRYGRTRNTSFWLHHAHMLQLYDTKILSIFFFDLNHATPSHYDAIILLYQQQERVTLIK